MRGFIEAAPNSLPLQRPTLTGGFDNALVQGLTVRVLPESKAGGPVLDDRQAVPHDPSTANTWFMFLRGRRHGPCEQAET